MSNYTLAISLSLLAAVAATTEAQLARQGSYSSYSGYYTGSYGSGDALSLLRSKQVIDELEILEDQTAEINALQKEMYETIREMMRGADYSGNAGQVVREAQRAIREQTAEKLGKILLPKQLKRMQEIQRQMNLRSKGARALLDEPLSAELNLSDEQKEMLTEKQREAQQEYNEKIRQMREQMRVDVIEAVLTKSQLRQLKQLTGEKYEVTPRGYPQPVSKTTK